MPARHRYGFELAGRSMAAVTMTYVLLLGGTFNGLLIPGAQRFSLLLFLIFIVIWQIVIWRRLSDDGADPLTMALLLWGLAYAVSVFQHASTRTSTGAWYAGFYAVVWIILSDFRRRGMPGRWITDGALLTAVSVMALAWVQVAAWFPDWQSADVRVAFIPPRPTSALGNPNVLGSVLAMLLPFGLVQARYGLRRPDRLLWRAWCVWALLTIFLTYSRGAWLATATSLLVFAVAMAWRYAMKGRTWTRRIYFSKRSLLVGGILTVIVVIMVVSVTLWTATSVFETPRRATGDRITFYRIAWQSFKAHPLTGTGPFTYGLTLLKQRSIPPDQPHSHAHNLILNTAAELGLLGLVALTTTVILIVRRLVKLMRHETRPREWAFMVACGASLAGFGVHSLVDMPMIFPAVMLLMLGILAAGVLKPLPNQTHRQRIVWGRWAYRVVAVLFSVVVLGAGWWSSRIYADYVRGEEYLVAGNDFQALATLKGVVHTRPDFPLYQSQYGFACGLSVFRGDEFCSPFEGISAYQRALQLEAPHAVWWANLAALYWQAEQGQQAIDAMGQAVHYAPDEPDFWLNLGIYAEASGQTDLARNAYQETLTRDARWSQTSFWTETALRRETLSQMSIEPTPYELAGTLWNAGNRPGALAVFDGVIRHDPSQPGPYIQLARLWLSVGDYDRTRDYLAAAELLVHADPDRAWIALTRADLALAQGEQTVWNYYRGAARHWLWPDWAGYTLYYGQDVALYQFLHVQIAEVLLPQLTVFSPDPELVGLLR